MYLKSITILLVLLCAAHCLLAESTAPSDESSQEIAYLKERVEHLEQLLREQSSAQSPGRKRILQSGASALPPGVVQSGNQFHEVLLDNRLNLRVVDSHEENEENYGALYVHSSSNGGGSLVYKNAAGQTFTLVSESGIVSAGNTSLDDVPTDSLALYHTFEPETVQGGSGQYEDLASSLVTSTVGDVHFPAKGYRGMGVYTGFGAILNSNYLAPTDAKTMTYWAKLHGWSTQDQFSGFAVSGSVFYLGTDSSYPREVFYGAGGSGYGVSEGVVLSLHTWYHFGLAFAGGSATAYLNGVPLLTTSHSSPSARGNIGIGGLVTNSAHMLATIDDFRVWSRKLSDEEVETVYDAEKQPEPVESDPDRPSWDDESFVLYHDFNDPQPVANPHMYTDSQNLIPTTYEGGVPSVSEDGVEGKAVRMYEGVRLSTNYHPNLYEKSLTYWVKYHSWLSHDMFVGTSPANGQFYIGWDSSYPTELFFGVANSVWSYSDGTPMDQLETWYHLGLTMGSGYVRAYLNGVEVASRSLSPSAITAIGEIYIGGTDACTGCTMDATVDEFRVWGRELSANEVASVFHLHSDILGVASSGPNATWNDEYLQVYHTFDNDTLSNDNVQYVDVVNGIVTSDVAGSHQSAPGMSGDGVLSVGNNVLNSNYYPRICTKTMSYWAKFHAFGAGDQFSGYTGSTGVFYIGHDSSYENRLFYWVGTGGVAGSAGSVQLGQWHHFVVTMSCDSTNVGSAYLDGTMVSTVSGFTAPTTRSQIGIGGLVSNQAVMSATIDNFRMWSRALSASEVADLYAYEYVPPVVPSVHTWNDTNMVLWYQFEDDSLESGEFIDAVNGVSTDTAAGAYTHSASGHIGKGLRVADGTRLMTHMEYNRDQKTVSFWVKWHSFLSHDMFLGGIQSGSQFYVGHDSSYPGELFFGVSSSSWTKSSGGKLNQLEQWYHVVLSMYSGTATGYVDGVAVASTSYGSPSDMVKFSVAGTEHTSCCGMDATLDDIRLWNRGLTAAEVADLYAYESSL